jgi:hypothetical protein
MLKIEEEIRSWVLFLKDENQKNIPDLYTIVAAMIYGFKIALI